jgi:hypothetical protein
MSTRCLVRMGVTALVAPIALVIGRGAASADPPSPGDPCPVWHQTTTDVDGNTMWCNPTMTGTHSFVWQYGGPA